MPFKIKEDRSISTTEHLDSCGSFNNPVVSDMSAIECTACERWFDQQSTEIAETNNKTAAKHRDIFRDTPIGKKVWRRRGSNPRPTGWETRKNFKHQPGFQVRT